MDELKISLPEVSATASQIRNYNSNLDETLSYVNRIMNELNSVWLSEGEAKEVKKSRAARNIAKVEIVFLQ